VTPVVDAKTITAALGGKWSEKQGYCRCPLHNDRRPSLAVKDGDCGVVVHCPAQRLRGCHDRVAGLLASHLNASSKKRPIAWRSRLTASSTEIPVFG
jgi:hypothetical protein